MGMSHGGQRQKDFNAYRETINVPLVVWSPRLAGGVRCELPVSLADLLPTLATVMGAEAPHSHGVDFAQALLDPAAAGPRDVLFSFGTNSSSAQSPAAIPCGNIRCVFDGHLKYAVYFDLEDDRATNPQYELYDLDADPDERHNLLWCPREAARALALDMRRRLDRLLARTDMAPAGWASIPAYQAWEGLTQLADLDTAFQEVYGSFTKAAELAVSTVFIGPGSLTLQRPGGDLTTLPIPAQVAGQLKAVAHLGPALYALGEVGRSGPAADWPDSLAAFRSKVQAAREVVRAAGWASAAWPGQEDAVRGLASRGLSIIDGFLSEHEGAPWSEGRYQQLMRSFAPVMAGCFLLALVNNTHGVLQILLGWREELGAEWSEVWPVIMGTTGSGSARGMSASTNNMPDILALVFSQEQLAQRLLLVPTASTVAGAQKALGNAVTTGSLGRVAFPDLGARNLLGIYASVISQDRDLAMGPTLAATQVLGMGGGVLQVPGLGPLEVKSPGFQVPA